LKTVPRVQIGKAIRSIATAVLLGLPKQPPTINFSAFVLSMAFDTMHNAATATTPSLERPSKSSSQVMMLETAKSAESPKRSRSAGKPMAIRKIATATPFSTA